MNRLCRIAGLVLVAASACYAAKPPQWIEVRSPNFSVVTDAGEGRGRDVALRFEQLRAVFGAMFGRQKIHMAVPLQIIAFRNSKEFEQHTPQWKGKATKLSGYFQPGEDRNFITIDVSQSDESWGTVFHEYAHLLLDSNFDATPVWFNEGFAEYFSTVKVLGRDVEIGAAAPGRVERLRSGLMPLTELFSVKSESDTYREAGDRRDLFYAESWLMVHYVFDKKKVPETAACFSLIEQGFSVPNSIQRAFGMTPEKLLRSVEDYFHTSSAFLYRLKLPEAVDHLAFATTVLDTADSQAVLADLHLHERDYHEQAMKEFQAVLRLNPDHAVANRGLGYGYLRDNDFEKAAEHFRRAAAQNSKDPRVHYYVAMLMTRQASMARHSPENVPALRKELETAVALDPQYADAWNLLAYVDSLEGEADKALEHMRHAVELSPRNDLYAANLATYLMNAKHWEEAQPILTRLQNSDKPDVAISARQNLEEVARVLKAKPALEQARREPAASPPTTEPAVKEEPPEESPKPEPPGPEVRPIKYLKGTLTIVDCSAAPAATLTIAASGKVWKMRTPDRKKLLLMGADAFSCDWKNRRVLVNYRAAEPGKADLVSLELQ